MTATNHLRVCLALCAWVSACEDPGSGAGSGATTSTSSGKAPAATSSATASAMASASAAPKASAAPATFGPDIAKVAIEAVNASTGYDRNQPQYALDGKMDTAWAAPGAGKPWLEIALLPGTKVDGIELAGQREATKTKDYWTKDAVIKRAVVKWDGGEAEVTFARATDKGQKKKVPIGVVTRHVRIEILETEPGEQSGDIDVDEIGIFGTAPTTNEPDAKGVTSLCRVHFSGPFGPAMSVRFSKGGVVGGEWTDSVDQNAQDVEPWRWTFFPIPVRVDDGEWHTLGVRYAEDSETLDDGTKNVKTRNAGKLLRFKVSGSTFEGDQDGTKASGKCEAK
jgi:F5/8 type C domain-containing protein